MLYNLFRIVNMIVSRFYKVGVLVYFREILKYEKNLIYDSYWSDVLLLSNMFDVL